METSEFLGTSSDNFRHIWNRSGCLQIGRAAFRNPGTPTKKLSRLSLRKCWQVYEGCIKAWSTSASLSLKGQSTEHTTVQWSIEPGLCISRKIYKNCCIAAHFTIFGSNH